MSPAIFRVEQRTSQGFQDVVDIYLTGFHGKHIAPPVPGGTVDKTLQSQDPGKLGHIVAAQAFCFTELRDAHSFFLPAARDSYENPQPVFFLCGNFHMCLIECL
jgi:hypothetical protein